MLRLKLLSFFSIVINRLIYIFSKILGETRYFESFPCIHLKKKAPALPTKPSINATMMSSRCIKDIKLLGTYPAKPTCVLFKSTIISIYIYILLSCINYIVLKNSFYWETFINTVLNVIPYIFIFNFIFCNPSTFW